ncbi:SKI2 subunit of superkiller complex protein [Condylostylus longicornis]|uniref:SKI2 subunit of superkiller complex protein n=1 Tax=Condylostylus longicornis TaxID=2530218 RepID=UPI00244E375E|nr:SKI2 subunit of superkiller complex protein [Condylostylus longicornis]
MNPFIEDQKKRLRNYITLPDVFLKQSDLEIISRTPNQNLLLNVTKSPASSTLKAKRNYLTGEITDFVEKVISHADANAKNSMSFKRAPNPEETIRGNPMNFPFWPGGFDEPLTDPDTICGNDVDFDEKPRLVTPPGFINGYTFENDTPLDNREENKVDLLEALEKWRDSIDEWMDSIEDNDNVENRKNEESVVFHTTQEDEHLLETVESSPVLPISQYSREKLFSSEWAEIIDTSKPVTNFKEKIYDMAKTFDFELDNFQKQAIIKLEEHEYVFVAAHTSAGKTAIAEYAIALSLKHGTKVIYTSPIKALSNQKYREFRENFKDVGLLTGDWQIEPKASCLIMTTEILRSMLFNGTETTRDIEYVIFDEIHYINDPDRGHVWEEVIMLLPENVNIIMLSATVSNFIELAEWVGMTKKRKVYVITTLKRPIALEHYLYLDSGGKKKENMHLIVDSDNRFRVETFRELKAEFEKKNSKNWSQWDNLINHLQKKNMLPVIVFTLSRNRCDFNALALRSKDLNTAKEKSAVHNYFQKYCMSKLKPEDRNLSQVNLIKTSLERGIGIHHSGILPILKEIVEMAFQEGWVKVLFATETFAMGVNMPAKSVVFDSFKKHDGQELRFLKPSEYTQMAGRAGRRRNEVGTVILVCKQQLPSEIELQRMILGKADSLSSKFRLRYAAILRCLCVDNIQVEDLMKHCFKEFKYKKQLVTITELLKAKEEELSKIKNLDNSLQPLESFFDCARRFLEIREKFMKKLLSSPNYLKEIKTGRVIIISFENHYNKLAIVLSLKITGSDNLKNTIKVLILDNQEIENQETTGNELWHKMISLTKEMQFFRPVGAGGHRILEIKFEHVTDITKSLIKVEPDLIIKNWEQRQIERFKDSPPGQSVLKAVTELNQLNESYISNPNSLQTMDLKKGFSLNIEEEDEYLWREFNTSKKNLREILPYTSIANFKSDFKTVFEKKNLEMEVDELKFRSSPKSLTLYDDYSYKLKVLKELGYVDKNEKVLLKGKIACEMGQNELFVMELIYSNSFEDLEPAEIAALLSGLVFQAKTNTEYKINEKLKEGKKRFEEINKRIEDAERNNGVNSGPENRLNFGLIEVVYEWARNKPFSEITELTDIQEGIIVRCIQQLNETIQDVKTAASRISHTTNSILKQKMEEALVAIKRDIVFAESLYTSNTK